MHFQARSSNHPTKSLDPKPLIMKLSLLFSASAAFLLAAAAPDESVSSYAGADAIHQ